jgi:beta-galactosidase
MVRSYICRRTNNVATISYLQRPTPSHSLDRGLQRLLLCVLLLLAACSADKPERSFIESERIIQPLNQQWQFRLAPQDDETSAPKKSWKDVTLPHTWNNKDGQDGGDDYHRGTGIYRLDLHLDEQYQHKKLYLHFDGAAISTRVSVNGKLAGTHKGSYGAFRFDITQLVNIGENNLIEVQVSNTEDLEVAPLSADFTFFGGLYRQARLIATSPLHLDAMNYASSGVFW